MENDKFITEKSITQISDKANEEEFEIELKVNKKPGIKQPEKKIDLQIAFDNSASMTSTDSNDTVFSDAKESVKTMISGLDNTIDRVGLTPYKGSRRNGDDGNPLPYSIDTKVSLSNNFDLAKSEIDNMTGDGETPMYSGVKNAITDLKSNARPDAEKKLVIVSDGEPNVTKPIIMTSDTPVGYDENAPLGIDTSEKKYEKYLYEYRYADPSDKITVKNVDFGQDSFYYEFGSDPYRTPDYLISNKYREFWEGGFDFLRKEVKDEVQKAKDAGIEVYVVYIQRYNTKNPRYTINEDLFKQTSINFMEDLASSNGNFFTIDALDSQHKLHEIFKRIKEKIEPRNHEITDEIIDEFSIVPNSFKAELDGIDKTNEIVPVEEDNKLTWDFNDEGRDEYELKLKYRIKRKIDTKGGTYITSVNPAELKYNNKVGNTLIPQKLEFPETKVTLKEFEELKLDVTTKPAVEVTTKSSVVIKDENNNEGTVTIRYLEKNTNIELKPSVTINGTVGIEYKTTAKTISNYKLYKSPDNITGKYIDGNIEVIYYYEKAKNKKKTSSSGDESSENEKGTLIVRYLDKSTKKELSESVITKENIGTTYNVESKNIDGYILLEMPDNTNGKYTDGKTEIIYYYGKKISTIDELIPQGKITIKEGNLIVKYLEKGTNKELGSEILSKDVVGKDYETKASNISGYELIEVPSNEKGKYIDGTIEVTYYYGPKIEIPDDEIPQGKPSISENSKKLPKTGENSKLPYYIIGALFIIAGLGIRKNLKTTK